MASSNQRYQDDPSRSIIKLNSFCFYSSSVFIVLLAFITFITKTNFKLQIQKSIRSPTISMAADSGSASPPYCVIWMAPFLSGGGYSSEAWSYISSVHRYMKNPGFKLGIIQHGDEESLEFWKGLSQTERTLAIDLHQTQCSASKTIVVCHSEPGAWHPPLFETPPCPPYGHYDHFMAVIGRTMFETDRVNPEHVKRCNRMDRIWVPTEFHVSTFINSGVEPSRVSKIVQPVDVDFFNPSMHEPFDLASIAGSSLLGPNLKNREKKFVFLSVFKWEYRKGWDVLLKAYLQEFSSIDGVALYLLTNPYHTGKDFGNKIVEFVVDSRIEKPKVHGWAPVHVIDTHIAQSDLPRLFKAADSFVLPSRGEGWGRPIVEAMAMALPVIATNWSGPTEYLTEENGYPLAVEGMSKVMNGPFKGHLWAEPSDRELRCLMRHVMSHAEEARAKGMKGREDMVNNFSPEIVANIVTDQLKGIVNNTCIGDCTPNT